MVQTHFSKDCRWVWMPELTAATPGFVIFELPFDIPGGGKWWLRYSADNRCNIRLDGQIIARGPGKSDLEHYYFDQAQGGIAAGSHLLQVEVVVWANNFRNLPGPWSEMHAGGGWLADGGVIGANGEMLANFATPGAWRVRRDSSRSHRGWAQAWAIPDTLPCPPMEAVDLRGEPEKSEWLPPAVLGKVFERAALATDNDTRWLLVPRPIPSLDEQPAAIAAIRSVSNPASRLVLDEAGNLSGTLAAGETTVLLDLGEYRTVFAELSGEGASGECRVGWAESLFVAGKKQMRDAEAGVVGDYGYGDELSFGARPWRWDSFWFRSGRWVELRFVCGEVLRLTRFALRSWHYPFEWRGQVDWTEQPAWRRLAEVCWRTVLCCAHETYEDCPYWEQLQYVGDTRLQAKISYAVTGDDRLARQAMAHFAQSLIPEGFTQSRYPSNWLQVIPQFSLYWVLMFADHDEYFRDREWFERFRPQIFSVLNAFERLRREDGLIGATGYWNITDWAPEWPGGKSDRGTGEPETINNLIYAEACRRIAGLLRDDDSARANLLLRYRRTIDAVNCGCFDPDKGCFSDVPGRKWFSCHVNAWAVIADAVAPERQKELAHHVLADPELVQPTLYFKAYLFEMLRKLRMYREVPGLFAAWERVLEWGFSTFPETPDPASRSDCHAWSATPLAEMVTTILGVTPGAPGFETIRIAPWMPVKGCAPIGSEELLLLRFHSPQPHIWALELACRTPRNVWVIWPDGAEERHRLSGNLWLTHQR